MPPTPHGERAGIEGQNFSVRCRETLVSPPVSGSPPLMPLEPDATAAPEIAACLDQLRAGDLGVRDRIIEVCSGRLRLLAHRMLSRFPGVRRWDDTDDVFQNSALRLHRALGETLPETPRALMALAATQLHRELIDLARRHSGPMSFAANHATNPPQARAGSEPASTPPAAVEAAAAPDEGLDRWTQFHDAIAALPAELREVFHLVWYIGADQRSIARLLDCSERTVKSRWREAREAVRAALDGRPLG